MQTISTKQYRQYSDVQKFKQERLDIIVHALERLISQHQDNTYFDASNWLSGTNRSIKKRHCALQIDGVNML
jgi:hypothetical protein